MSKGDVGARSLVLAASCYPFAGLLFRPGRPAAARRQRSTVR